MGPLTLRTREKEDGASGHGPRRVSSLELHLAPLPGQSAATRQFLLVLGGSAAPLVQVNASVLCGMVVGVGMC